MGASRRAWRAVERAQMKDAARRVRMVKRAERQEALTVEAQALAMADAFKQPSGLVRDPQTGEPVYAVAREMRDVQ